MSRKNSWTDPTIIGEHRETVWFHRPEINSISGNVVIRPFPSHASKSPTAASHDVARIARSHSHAAPIPDRTQLATRISPADDGGSRRLLGGGVACATFWKSIFQRTAAPDSDQISASHRDDAMCHGYTHRQGRLILYALHVSKGVLRIRSENTASLGNE